MFVCFAPQLQLDDMDLMSSADESSNMRTAPVVAIPDLLADIVRLADYDHKLSYWVQGPAGGTATRRASDAGMPPTTPAAAAGGRSTATPTSSSRPWVREDDRAAMVSPGQLVQRVTSSWLPSSRLARAAQRVAYLLPYSLSRGEMDPKDLEGLREMTQVVLQPPNAVMLLLERLQANEDKLLTGVLALGAGLKRSHNLIVSSDQSQCLWPSTCHLFTAMQLAQA